MVKLRNRAPLGANEPILSEFQCAELLGIAIGTLQTWRGHDEGPPYCRVSKGVVRYLRTRVVEWLDARIVAGGAPLTDEEEGPR